MTALSIMLDVFRKSNLFLEPLLTTLFLGFATIVLFLWYSIRKQSYWKKIGIPYATPIPILGSYWEYFTKTLQDVELDRYNKYGRIYGHYEVNRSLISIGEPEILRRILVKDFQAFSARRSLKTGTEVIDKGLSSVQGEDWRRIRTILTPAFTTGKLKRLMGIFKDCSGTLIQHFRVAAEKGEPVDAKRLYGAFTLDTIACSAFSTKIDSHNDPFNPFVQNAREILNMKFNWRFVAMMLVPGIMRSLNISIVPMKGFNFFFNVILQMIEERKRTGQKGNDFLQVLLDTAEEVSQEGKLDESKEDDILDNYGKDENEEVFKQTSTKKTLSYNEIVAQCLLFFLGGYVTTYSTLSIASYYLALNSDMQEKLIKEVDDALKENDGELTYEAVQKMKYLDNVISETLRLYPPSIRLERAADEDYKLGDTGLTIPKGMIVSVPVYAIHRDPKFFPNPDKFDPDRFTTEERSKRDQYTYIPFGAGPRNCVGMRFALIEMKVCLAHVLTYFRIKTCSETQVPLEFHKGQPLLQAKEIKLTFEPRKDSIKAS